MKGLQITKDVTIDKARGEDFVINTKEVSSTRVIDTFRFTPYSHPQYTVTIPGPFTGAPWLCLKYPHGLGYVPMYMAFTTVNDKFTGSTEQFASTSLSINCTVDNRYINVTFGDPSFDTSTQYKLIIVTLFAEKLSDD